MKIRFRLVNAMDRNGDVLTGEEFLRAVHDWARRMDATVHETGADYASCSMELPDDETSENIPTALRAP